MRVLRRIFGTRRDEETGELSRLYNKELYDLYSSHFIIRIINPRIMRWAGHAARKAERRGTQRVLVAKPERKRSLVRSRCIWEDNIKMGI